MYSDDSDCVVLGENPAKSVKRGRSSANYDSDDLVVVSEKGLVPCRDYPHPRHLCAIFPFASTPHENHCARCHCYVCDSLAPCGFWGTGISRNDHCHANDKDGSWKDQRENTKASGPVQPIVTPSEPISFSDRDLPRRSHHGDALVISLCLGTSKICVRRILVDIGSNVNVLFFDAFKKMGLTRDHMRLDRPRLVDFLGSSVEGKGSILLWVEVGEYPRVKALSMEFVVVDMESAYNGILGQPGVCDLDGVISMGHLCMKFETPNGIGVARGDQEMARVCEMNASKIGGRICHRLPSVIRIDRVSD